MTEQSVNSKLTELFARHYDGVLAYSARRIGRNEAEDAAAEGLRLCGGYPLAAHV